jgi:hypothetical protein
MQKLRSLQKEKRQLYSTSVSENDCGGVSERHKLLRARVLRVTKALLAGQTGVIEASRELSPLRHEADPRIAEILLVFAGIDSETDSLPIGEVRQYWNGESLKRKDREIAEAEQFYRESAMNAATELLRAIEIPS